MASVQHQGRVDTDAGRLEEAGAYVIGGILPFLSAVLATTLGLLTLALIAGLELNIWLTLFIPVILGVIGAGLWIRHKSP